MIVVVNGTETEVEDGATLLDLLAAREIAPEGVVAELNREIVPGSDFGTTRLNDGDHLELLRFVGGG
jgi:sulfur carrier protein